MSQPSVPFLLQRMLCLADFELVARRRLPRSVYGYVSGAVEERTAMHDNDRALANYAFETRVLRNVSKRSQQVELFGHTYATPFGIAPMGLAALSSYRGDIVLAQAADTRNIASIMSATSLIPMEEVVKLAPRTWFQAYLPGDQRRVDALLDRVERNGFETLVITVDIPVNASRENNIRTGFSTPLKPSFSLVWDGISHPRWLIATMIRTLLLHGMPYFENSFAERGAPIISSTVLRDFTARDHLDWTHIDRIRQRWHGRLVIKGILHVEDALQAQHIGADAVYLSNHGGRQLDGSVSALRTLEAVVAAVGPAFPVLIDGGFRRGGDVLKALALGARMVFVGRPFNYASVVAGADGVLRAIDLLREEIQRNLGMLGATSCDELRSLQLIRRIG